MFKDRTLRLEKERSILGGAIEPVFYLSHPSYSIFDLKTWRGFLAGSGTGSGTPSVGLLQAGGGQLPCLLQPCPNRTAVLFDKGDERKTFDVRPSHHNHAGMLPFDFIMKLLQLIPDPDWQ